MNLACFPANFMLFLTYEAGSFWVFGLFSFGVCKVRDTTARKLKGVKRVGPRYSSRTPGSYFTNKPKERSATQATHLTVISHLHRSMIYLTFMMNVILFRTALTFSVSWLITYIKFPVVHNIKIASHADVLRGSSRVPAPRSLLNWKINSFPIVPAPRSLLNWKINSFPIVRKYQLEITCRLSEIQSALLKSQTHT